GVVEHLADVLGGDLLLQLHLHLGAADEVDAPVDAAHREEDDGQHDERAGDLEPERLLSDELDGGLGIEETQHGCVTRQMESVSVHFEAYMSKKTRTTKTELTREVTTPMSSVVAKFCTGPVPNCQSTMPAMNVVTLASRMALKALSKPSETAERGVLPAR